MPKTNSQKLTKKQNSINQYFPRTVVRKEIAAAPIRNDKVAKPYFVEALKKRLAANEDEMVPSTSSNENITQLEQLNTSLPSTLITLPITNKMITVRTHNLITIISPLLLNK